MTYTTAHREYAAKTFAEAGEAMLRDSDVWDIRAAGRQVRGDQKGYTVNNWEWHATGEGGTLTVWFR